MALDFSAQDLVSLERRTGDSPAANGGGVASGGLPVILAVEIKQAGETSGRSRVDRTHSSNVESQPDVGQSTDPC